MDLIDYIVWTYVFIDDWFKKTIDRKRLRQRGFEPSLADSEVLTMEIIGEYLGLATDTAIYRYFQRHWHQFFPALPHRSNFVRQAGNLLQVKQQFFEYLSQPFEHDLQIIDSMPIEVCRFVRARRSKQFKGDARYGHWHGQTFFGFRLHLKIDQRGMIHTGIIAPANEHDSSYVDSLLGQDTHGWLLADKGYRGNERKERLWQDRRIYFYTPLQRHEISQCQLTEPTKRQLNGIRRLVETVAGQLSEQFNIKTTTARDTWHLTNRVVRKVLSHTLAIYTNIQQGKKPLAIVPLVR